jgi:hypothetical protein
MKKKEKAGWPGFPRNGKERARTEGESGMARVPSQWEGTGQEEKGEIRMGVPSQWKGTGQEEKGESGMAGVPSQWEGTGQEEKGESGMAGVPSQWEGTGQEDRERDVSKVGSGVGVGGWFGSGTGSGIRIGIRMGMSSAGSARSFCCLGRAMVGLRAAGDSRLGRWGARLSAESGKKHGFRGGFGGRC